MTINVGLVGFGFGAQTFHAPFLDRKPFFNLYKVLERHKDNAALKYPSAITVRDYNAILDDPLVGLVVIVTPNQTHYPMVKQALLAGKNVVVDKPFTVTSEEADELTALASDKKLLLSVYQSMRFHGDFMTVQKLLDDDILGELVDYEAHFDRFHNRLRAKPWKEVPDKGVDILYDIGAHLIDQALILFGKPNEIFADLTIQRDGSQVIDSFFVMLYYDKLRAILRGGMLVKEDSPRFIIHGKKGSYIKCGADTQERVLSSPYPITLEETPGTLYLDYDGETLESTLRTKKGSYWLYYENIYNVLTGTENTELLVKPEQASDVIRLIELAFESWETGMRLKCK